MVKALAAAPERWSKIYCLSRRPPPDYFFEGMAVVSWELVQSWQCWSADSVPELGEGAERVEHVEADFLGKPEDIADNLKQKIKKV